MDIVIVYASQYGNTERIARAMGSALEPRHAVHVVAAADARGLSGAGVDLLMVGAPTQIHGLRLLVRSFLGGLRSHGFAGVPAAAFDTRFQGPKGRTGAVSDVIAKRLAAVGCRLVVPAESLFVADMEGPLVEGEERRAWLWAQDVAEALAVAQPA
ncbi:MAG: flavodoxin family protein [Candidatus Limnocylindrales bacterium]